jgi:hypothetical protein
MGNPNRDPLVTAENQVDRAGRHQQLAPETGFGVPTSKLEQRTGLQESDAPRDGIDSADFPGAGAP